MLYRNNFLKLKMSAFNYSDRIIVIICVNNCKNIHRLRLVKFLFSLSTSASAFAPSTQISFRPKIMTKWKNNRLIIAIINKNRNFVWIIIIKINIKTQ